MKKISLLVILLIIVSFSYSQQKAFGDLYFGMTPKEVKKAYKTNKEKHSLGIGEWKFITSVNACKFTNEGLYQVSLWAQELGYAKRLTSVNADKLLVSVKDVFLAAGYELVEQHVFFPKAMVMRYDPHCLVMKNDEKRKVVKVRINKRMKSFSDRYPIWIDLIPFEQMSKVVSNTSELDDKL
jgi:hypothetical protein